jgi:hypothetical protein
MGLEKIIVASSEVEDMEADKNNNVTKNPIPREPIKKNLISSRGLSFCLGDIKNRNTPPIINLDRANVVKLIP